MKMALATPTTTPTATKLSATGGVTLSLRSDAVSNNNHSLLPLQCTYIHTYVYARASRIFQPFN